MKIPKHTIEKKAYIVWHRGMIDTYSYEGFLSIHEIPVTYAECETDAKRKAKDLLNDYFIDGQPHKYSDIKTKRSLNQDYIKLEEDFLHHKKNEVVKRHHLHYNIDLHKKKEERKKIVESYHPDTKFYIQSGYVGNSVLWWRKNSSGYTTNIDDAQQYSRNEILKSHLNCRDEDHIWESEHVLKNVSKHVNSQHLDLTYKLF